MRKLFIIFLFFSLKLSATDYYVKTGGNDGANGLSDATAWATIAKVNSSLSPGDRVFFKSGDTFYGNIIVSDASVTYGTYGGTTKAIITGFTTISGWTNVGGGIYSKAISPQSAPNMVTVDGVNTAMGRYPDATYNTIETGGSSSFVDNDLSASPDWDGAEVVIRKNRWIIDRCAITSHAGTSVSYTSPSSYPSEAGWGYFIQNDLATLTTLGEWYYSSGTFYMYFGAVDPTTKEVKVSIVDEIISNSGYDYITLDNLDLQGGNTRIVDIESSLGSSITNCNIQYSGGHGIYGVYYNVAESDGFIVDNNTISDCNESAIDIWYQFTNAEIKNNTITNIGTIAGMGGSGDGHYLAVQLVGATGSLIEHNHISYCGYIPLSVTSAYTIINNNFIHHYGYVKDDVGGIYTVTNSGYSWPGIEIRNNVVMYGIGATDGAYLPYGEIAYANGIYLDFNASGVIVDGNTTAYCGLAGVYLHSNMSSTITNNTAFGNTYAQFYMLSDPSSGYEDMRLMSVSGNKWISKGGGEYTAVFETNYGSDDIAQFFTASDNNIITRPYEDNSTMMTKVNGTQTGRTLAAWQSVYSLDGASTKSLGTAIADTANINYIYNGTSINKSFNLSQAMDDVANTSYADNIVLLPYTSLILLGAGDVTEGSDPPPNYPTVTTGAITAITNATATGSGEVIDNGGGTISARGVCFHTTTNPTIARRTVPSGTGTGSFTASITGLTADSIYYVRAYAINETGPAYGDVVSFTASEGVLLAIGNSLIVDANGVPIRYVVPTPPPYVPPAIDLSVGVIGYWDMDDTGVDQVDAVGSNDLTNSGAMVDVAGKIDKAVDFNTNTDYLIKQAASLTLGTDETTINLWFKLDNLSDASLIEFTNETDWTQTFFLRVYSDGMMAGAFTNTSNASAVLFTAASTVSTGTWYMATFVNYGDGLPPKLYINGVDVTSSADNFSGSLKTLHDFLIVGNQDNFETKAPDGLIDNLTIWNKALSEAEIVELYTLENAGTVYPY